MSLMTHEDTVPWGESIRVELLVGHMPPWSVEGSPGRFRNVQPLTAREMNVLLTWATGGTPLGDPDKLKPAAAQEAAWPLGSPDLEIPLPRTVTLASSEQERTDEFVVRVGSSDRRFLRAVDLKPGTPSIVRSAVIRIQAASSSAAGAGGEERVLAIWQPGDEPVALPHGVGFELPPRAELQVTVHYRKTWQQERQEMHDRSTIGLYFDSGPSRPLRAVTLDAATRSTTGPSDRISFGQTLGEDVQALAIYPDERLTGGRIEVAAVGTDGARRELIAFRPRTGWARRYWFREPITLTRGTRLDASISFTDEAPVLPLSVAPSDVKRPDPSTLRVTLNVAPAR
jgi:hypothetical protein